MIELYRIVEHQSGRYSYEATANENEALQLENLLEQTKPANLFQDWHILIANPFRYSPPHPEVRFRPVFGKNVFFGACRELTALYEYTYYLLLERLHLPKVNETGLRTIFSVCANDDSASDINGLDNISDIMNNHNYIASHEFINSNPDITFLLYPSCRDPEQGKNAAIFDIKHLDKVPNWEASLNFFFDCSRQSIKWIDFNLSISYEHVA